jgi:hypothetical protein
MTLEDVGRKFGVTRERIRQLQNVALTSTEALCPPKPKLLLMAVLIGTSRAVFGTQSRSHSGSWWSTLMVGGTMPVVDRHDRGDQLDAAGRAEHVAGHGFGGTDHQAVLGMVAEGQLDGLGFRDVAEARGGGVGVEIVTSSGIDAAVAQGHAMA